VTGPGGEFQEIGHSGGQVIFNVVTDEEGHRKYAVRWQSSRPVPAALFGIYALRQGIPVGLIDMGGIGTPWNPPPVAGSVPVFISSDSQGLFGSECPRCHGYWRSREHPCVCPYCGIVEQRQNFLTRAQRRYVWQYCSRLNEALADEQDGDHIIDMDAVADAAGQDGEKPPFYYAEEQQQHKFKCAACDATNDIIGRFGFCCACGTRNDWHELEANIIPAIRQRVNEGAVSGSTLREIGSAFDSFVSQYVKQLLVGVPMTPARKNRLQNTRFHNLTSVAEELKGTFGIDLFSGLKAGDREHASLMFRRRHVYEHNGGQVDERYLQESGDTTVRLNQALREHAGSLHRFANSIAQMGRNLHEGFSQIFPPEEGPIRAFQAQKARMAAYPKQGR
jgi:hypothetical protein